MAYVTKNNQMRYVEFGNFVVDYSDGDIMLLDNVKDLAPLFPLNSSTILICVCVKGRQKATVNGNERNIAEGTIQLYSSGAKTTFGETIDDFTCKVLCMSKHLVRSLLRDKIDVWHHTATPYGVTSVGIAETFIEEFRLYFSLIRSKLKRATPATYEILLALMRVLMLELCFLLENANGIQRDHKMSQGKMLFNRFLSLVSNNAVKRQPITFYAEQLAITPKYLTMLCMKYSDKTASQWVAQYTVEEIRYYLKNTDLSIKEISARLGFSNMSHFGSYVRKHLGVSPSEYRFSKKE